MSQNQSQARVAIPAKDACPHHSEGDNSPQNEAFAMTNLQKRQQLRADAFAHGMNITKQRIWQHARQVEGEERAFIVNNHEQATLKYRDRYNLAIKHKFYIEAAINNGALKAWDDALEWALGA